VRLESLFQDLSRSCQLQVIIFDLFIKRKVGYGVSVKEETEYNFPTAHNNTYNQWWGSV
jgi:hypothetical protein